jgi:predicted permease
VLDLFVNVVLPVFVVAGIGYVFERRFRPPIAPLNQIALFVLMPSLIFQSLLPVDFSREEPLRVTAFAFLLVVAMIAVALVIARVARLDRVTTSAFTLTAAFPNLGNYGLPVVLLAYGQEGLGVGTLLLAVQSLYGIALAVFIASSGATTMRRALGEVARQPIMYAVVAALALNLAHIQLPAFLAAAIALPAQAAVPVMLLVLGMNFASTTRIEEPTLVGLATFTRLVVGVVVGWLLVDALGIGGVARGVLIVGSAMPTAVFTILTATQFGARPRFVSDCVIASTLASIVTVTAVLALLTGRLTFP